MEISNIEKVMINIRCKKCRKKFFHLECFHIQRDYWRGKKKEFYWRFTKFLCNNSVDIAFEYSFTSKDIRQVSIHVW